MGYGGRSVVRGPPKTPKNPIFRPPGGGPPGPRKTPKNPVFRPPPKPPFSGFCKVRTFVQTVQNGRFWRFWGFSGGFYGDPFWDPQKGYISPAYIGTMESMDSWGKPGFWGFWRFAGIPGIPRNAQIPPADLTGPPRSGFCSLKKWVFRGTRTGCFSRVFRGFSGGCFPGVSGTRFRGGPTSGMACDGGDRIAWWIDAYRWDRSTHWGSIDRSMACDDGGRASFIHWVQAFGGTGYPWIGVFGPLQRMPTGLTTPPLKRPSRRTF